MENLKSWIKTFFGEIRSASEEDALNLYFKLRLKYATANKNIWFNKTCLLENIIPNYVHIKTNNRSAIASRVVRDSRKKWVSLEINKHYQLRDTFKYYLYEIHTRLRYIKRMWPRNNCSLFKKTGLR